ncbi:MAG: hypothetical protein Q4A65_08015 [Bacillota bacterium]|nr:hypothetical protein [Bacillota bacterium]
MAKKSKEVTTILNKVSSAGYDIYCAGECVAATELGGSPLDWDMYTTCPQDKIREMFPEGEAIGKRTTRLDYSTFIESNDLQNIADHYDGIIADIVTLEGSMEEQLRIYDFTCEAIADHPSRAAIDPYGGLSDIKRRLLQPVGDANDKFKAKPILMLKALRYVGLYGFDLSRDLYNAIKANSDRLEFADKEEILYEFSTAINGNHAGKYLKMIKGLGLLKILVGEEGLVSDHRSKNDYDILCENIDRIKHITLRRLGLFYLCFEKHYEKAVTYLPHDELDQEYLLEAKRELPKLHFAGDDKALKKFICRHGWDKYNYFDKLSKAQVIVYGYSNQRVTGRDAILKEILAQHQPIFVEDLKIDADDIIEAGITNDRKRAEELLMMLTDIVHTKVQNNDRDILLKHARIFNKSKLRAAFRDVSWLR